MECVNNTHENESMRWDSLPEWERERRGLYNFRMYESDFRDLYSLCAPLMSEHSARDGFRTYSKRTQLLVTLHFLAHAHTLRVVSEKFGLPHNSISRCCIERGIDVIRKVFVVNSGTNNIRWPRSAAAQVAVMDEFKAEFRLPGCIGAIDGSLIPMKKPPSKYTGGDSDSFWCWKGHCGILLLAVVDARCRFQYINVGAPGTVGDAGLYAQSELCAQIDVGLLKRVSVPIVVDNDVQQVTPFLVGDSAFALSEHMLKNYDIFSRETRESPSKTEFNRRLTNCRRLSEMAFGRLKGRWAICTRNHTYYRPAICRVMTEASCGLHNFLEDRKRDVPQLDVLEQRNEPAGAAGPAVAATAIGARKRELLTKWVSENM